MPSRFILVLLGAVAVVVAIPLMIVLFFVPVRGEAKPGPVVDHNAAVERVRGDFARDLGLGRNDLTVVEVKQHDWPNGCLGLPADGEFCTEAIVPGYHITFRTPASDHYFVRSNGDGSHYRVEGEGDHLNPAPGEIADLVRFALVQRVNDASLEVRSIEEQEWPDGCLGLPHPGPCTQVIVPGYRIVLDGEAGEYVARTNVEGSFYRLESGPVRIPHSPAFAWRSTSDAGCIEIALFEDGTGVVSACGEAPTVFSITQQQSLQFLARTLRYQPIDQQDDDIRFVIRGSGEHGATEQELRAVGEWATLEAQAAYVGRRGASWGLAVAWQEKSTDGCVSAHLERYGVAFISRCTPDTNLEDVVLDADQLATLYAWLDRYGPFEDYAADGESFFVFAGSGSEEPDEATRTEIRTWLEALHPDRQ